MDRAGLTPAYAVEVRHSADHAQQQATEQALKDPQDMAREILRVLPDVVAVLPADEVRSHLSQIKSFLV
jgi:chorismate mutase